MIECCQKANGGVMMAGALLLVMLAAVLVWRKEAREAKRLGAKLYTAAYHLLGIPRLEPKKVVRLFFSDDRLIIRSGKQTFELNYDKVTAIKAARKTDLIQKNKSVIGRGVVGGVAFGGIGAIVGALSAVGEKKGDERKPADRLLQAGRAGRAATDGI